MWLRIGELAKRVGLTVRALHHYDAIGLLSPSGRSEGGYRLYGQADVMRLHAIQALRTFGCSLAEIREALSRGEVALPEILARQIDVLEAKARRAGELRDRLCRLRERVLRKEATGMADWLETLGKMHMYERYFSAEELAVLRAGLGGDAERARGLWRELVAAVREAMARGASPEGEEARDLVRPMVRLGRKLTGGDAGLAARLREMLVREERARDATGLTPEILAWIDRAVAALKQTTAAAATRPDPAVDGLTEVSVGVGREEKTDVDIIPEDAALDDMPADAAVAAIAKGAAVADRPENLAGNVASEHPSPGETRTVAGPAGTALSVATLRAAHQLLDQPPVFVDPLALPIVGPGREAAIRKAPARFDAGHLRGLRASVAVRSRLAEDVWGQARERGVSQYVILGAGFDTFAYRTPDRESRLVEVDHPGTQAQKRRRLAEAGLDAPANLAFVPMDFEGSAGLIEALTRAGFRREAPAFFSWLGVTMYLSPETVYGTLGVVAGLAPGTEVVFDYPVAPELLSPGERAGREAVMARAAAKSEPWKSAFEPHAMAARLAALGFRSVTDFDGPGLTRRYLGGRTDGLRKSGVTRIAWATVGEPAA